MRCGDRRHFFPDEVQRNPGLGRHVNHCVAELARFEPTQYVSSAPQPWDSSDRARTAVEAA
jgi:hypothetical protein